MVAEPKEAASQPKQSNFLRVVLVFALGATIIGSGSFYLISSSEALLLTCIGQKAGLPPGIACSYFHEVRNPSPNDLVQSKVDSKQSIFAFFLSLYEEGDAAHEGILDSFLANGVDWEMAHNGYFPPLHLAILDGRIQLVERFLKSGAPTSTTINAPGKRTHGLNAIDFTRSMLSKNLSPEMKSKLEQIDAILIKAGAQSQQPPPMKKVESPSTNDGGVPPAKGEE